MNDLPAFVNKGFVQQPDGSFSKNDMKHRGKPPAHLALEAEGRPDSERELQNQIANWLRQHDTWFAQSRMDRKTSNGKGQPDFLFSWPMINGNCAAVAVEAKSGTGKLTTEQEQVKAQMELNGWKHFVIRSVVELKESLERL